MTICLNFNPFWCIINKDSKYEKNHCNYNNFFHCFVFFRFYNLEKRVIFDWDQENYSFQVKRILVEKRLTLIGPRVKDETGFFLAPYFFYLLTPFYFFTTLHPSALIIFLIFYNSLSFFLSFYFLKNLFGIWQAIFFLAFWSINYLLINFETTPWNPIVIPIATIIVWHLTKLSFEDKNNKWWFYLFSGFLIGFFNNFHFQFILLLIFFLFFEVILSINKKKLSIKKFILILLGYFLTFLPIIIFDFRHNFLNLKGFQQLFFSSKLKSKDINIWWEVFSNFLQPIIQVNNVLMTKLFYLIFIFIILYLIKKTQKRFFKLFYQLTLFLWLIFPLFFIFYGQRPSEYYFIFLYPFIYITLIELLRRLNKFLPLVIFVIIFLSTKEEIYLELKNQPQSLFYKIQTIKKIKEIVNSQKFNISFSTPLGRNHGFSYLIDYFQIKQSRNFKDPLIEIRIPPKREDVKINEEIGIKIPKELKK